MIFEEEAASPPSREDPFSLILPEAGAQPSASPTSGEPLLIVSDSAPPSAIFPSEPNEPTSLPVMPSPLPAPAAQDKKADRPSWLPPGAEMLLWDGWQDETLDTVRCACCCRCACLLPRYLLSRCARM